MLDIETIKNTIKEFAEKYNFVQQIDIEQVETEDFNRQNYLKIHDKKFVSIDKYTNKTEIIFGKIIIEIDTIDEEEFYSIDKNRYFFINILDYPNEDELMEVIIKECKKYNLI
jgi:hypothetical protein